MLTARLVDLLSCSSKKMQVHLWTARLIQAPISEILIVHALDPKHVVHCPTHGHRNAHEIHRFLICQL
jgi:hypothetical protein